MVPIPPSCCLVQGGCTHLPYTVCVLAIRPVCSEVAYEEHSHKEDVH